MTTETCPHCGGTGQPNGIMGGPEHGLCSYCSGTGRRSAASAEPAVAVKALRWQHYPHAFPPCWCADTPFGDYTIDESCGSDSPSYEARGPLARVLSVTEGLPEAQAAAQADYEQRVRSALASPTPSPQAFVLEMNKCVEQANENATRAEENAARAERLEKELQTLRCKVSASPPPSPVASEEMVRLVDAIRLYAADARDTQYIPKGALGNIRSILDCARKLKDALSHAPPGRRDGGRWRARRGTGRRSICGPNGLRPAGGVDVLTLGTMSRRLTGCWTGSTGASTSSRPPSRIGCRALHPRQEATSREANRQPAWERGTNNVRNSD
jgi:hypothetical protein